MGPRTLPLCTSTTPAGSLLVWLPPDGPLPEPPDPTAPLLDLLLQLLLLRLNKLAIQPVRPKLSLCTEASRSCGAGGGIGIWEAREKGFSAAAAAATAAASLS